MIIVHLFLPILTWGINDIKGFFNHPVRFSYSVFIVLESIILGIKFYKNPINPLNSKGKDEKLVKLQRIIFPINRLLTIIILLSSSYFDKNDILIFVENIFIRISGLILFISGTLLAFWSNIHLGKQYSVDVTIQESHKLITDGPYSKIRNPMYTGIIISTIGMALIFRSIIGLVLNIPIILLFIWRISEEEKILRNEFKEKWDEYFNKTKRLVPFIY